MDKFKIVSLTLSVALLASLVRLVYVSKKQTPAADKVQTVMQNILQRKSVRSFTSEPVSREQIDTLLRAAMAAPTGRDMRPWKFVVIDERALLDTLSARLPYAKMLTQAPAAIVVCGDLSVTDAQGKPSTNWTFDCSAATENLLLAAEAMNLGAVWTGVHPYPERIEAVKQTLQLPEHIVPLCVVPIGHPKGNAQPKDKFNADNVRYNGW